MPKLSCAVCQWYLPDFCAGALGWRLKRQVAAHLRQCDQCLRSAEQEKLKQLGSRETVSHRVKRSRPEKGQALARWGTVFLMLMLLLSLLFYACDAWTFDQWEVSLRVWTELRYPQGRLGTKEIDWVGWWPYYRHERHYSLLDRRDALGRNRRLGTVVVSQVLGKRTVDVKLNQSAQWPMLSLPAQAESSGWRVPEGNNAHDGTNDSGRRIDNGNHQREDGGKGDAHEITNHERDRVDEGTDQSKYGGGGEIYDQEEPSATAWAALEQLPPSVTADMVFSTRHYLTPRAMMEMLSPYHIQLLGMYIFSGDPLEGQGEIPPLELVLWTPSSGNIVLEDSERTLYKKLSFVSRHPVVTEEEGLWNRRLAYIEEHGFQAYGISVRGSSRELLQLREVLELREPTIVGIDWALVP